MSKFFPYRNKYPVHVYDLFDELGRPAKISARWIREFIEDDPARNADGAVLYADADPETGGEALEPLGQLPRLPTTNWQRSTSESAAGWTTIPHGGIERLDDVVEAGEWAMFGRRVWKRSVPASFRAAHLAQREEEWKEERGVARVPASVRKELREAVDESLIRLSAPSIAESRILVDTLNQRLYLFDGPPKTRRIVVDRLRRLRNIDCRPYGLAAHFGRSRAYAELPAELGSRFLEWLVKRAEQGVWVHIDEPNGPGHDMHIGAADQMRGRYGDAWKSTLTARGEDLVETLRERMDGSVRLEEVRVTLTVASDEWDAEYDVVLDSTGAIVAMEILSGWPGLSDKGGDLIADLELRADATRSVVDHVRHLFELFDHDELATLLSAAPQIGLFPIEIKARPEFFAERPGAAPTTPRASDPNQLDLNEAIARASADGERTMKIGGADVTISDDGSVTITKDGTTEATTMDKIRKEAAKADKARRKREQRKGGDS